MNWKKKNQQVHMWRHINFGSFNEFGKRYTSATEKKKNGLKCDFWKYLNPIMFLNMFYTSISKLIPSAWNLQIFACGHCSTFTIVPLVNAEGLLSRHDQYGNLSGELEQL
jgi:hypothetical protein